MNIIEQIKLNVLANEPVDKKDKECFMSKNQSILARSEKFANFMGRRIIIGNLVGTARAIYGLAKTILCMAAHCLVFLTGLAVAILAPGVSKAYLPIFQFGAKLGDQTTDGILHVCRGAVEMVPLIGILILIKWDTRSTILS